MFLQKLCDKEHLIHELELELQNMKISTSRSIQLKKELSTHFKTTGIQRNYSGNINCYSQSPTGISYFKQVCCHKENNSAVSKNDQDENDAHHEADKFFSQMQQILHERYDTIFLEKVFP